MSVHLRHINYASDLRAIVELINAADAVDQLERGTTLEKFTREWSGPGRDPSRDLLLAVTDDGTVVGYTSLVCRTSQENYVFFSNGVVHPAWRRRGIGTRLLTESRRQAEERAVWLERDLPAYFQTFAREVEADRQAVYARMGMEPVRYFLNLVRPSLEDLSPPEWPRDLRVRPFRPGVDDEVTRLTLNEAFQDHWNHIPIPTDQWAYHLKSHQDQSGLWLLAWDGEECAGVCLCEIDKDWNARNGRREGLVDELAVRRRWRQRGLGTALLVAGLSLLRDARMESAHLFADAENLTGAVRLYHHVGFTERWRSTAYRLTIRAAVGRGIGT